jgi:hypothetical protein
MKVWPIANQCSPVTCIIKLFTAVINSISQKLVFVTASRIHSSLLLRGKARSLPFVWSSVIGSTQVASGLPSNVKLG